jgi:hypothetical protein
MNDVGVIRQYGDYQSHSEDENKINDIRHENYPLLGRRFELMFVAAQIAILDEHPNSINRRKDFAAIIFEG